MLVSALSPHSVLASCEFVTTIEDENGQTWIAVAPFETFASLGKALKMYEEEASVSFPMALMRGQKTEFLSAAEKSSWILEIFLKKGLELPKEKFMATSHFIDLVLPTFDPCNKLCPRKIRTRSTTKIPYPFSTGEAVIH